jgi:predicted MFS family arabinose efflux permease
VGAARTIALDALSFVVSVVSLLLIRKREPASAGASGAGALTEIGDGIALVFRNPVLRSLLLTMGLVIVSAHMVEPVELIFAYRVLHLTPAVLGIALSFDGAGAILGVAASGALGNRVGSGRIIVLTIFVNGVALLLLPVALFLKPAVVFAVAFFVLGFSGTVNNVFQWTLRQLLTPDTHMARMNSVFRTVYWGAWPLGNLVGGLAGSAIGPARVIVAAGVLVLFAGGLMAATAVRKA